MAKEERLAIAHRYVEMTGSGDGKPLSEGAQEG
jgi:hypothetical protein